MFDKLELTEKRFEEIDQKLSDASVISDQTQYRSLMKERAGIEDIVDRYREYKQTQKSYEENKELLNQTSDKEFMELVEAEIEQNQIMLEKLEQDLKLLLLPVDPNDEKNVIVEIRGATGGEEAALFAADLFRMYCRYAERNRWRVEMMSSNPTDIGGFKEVIFMIEGRGAYSRLKYESGVHRVQRVPETEASGRIHTSASTVAVLPEAEEVEVDINPNDIRIDVFRAGGPGGQCVNTTDSAVRITHIPTGLVVSCQDEKSQHKNKDKAMKILRSRLYDIMQRQQDDEVAQTRKEQVGSGDRSERIRTYNFPQGRVSDHRVALTLYRIESILDGDIDEIIDALVIDEQQKKLAKIEGKAI